jgi:plastocyanin
MPLVRRRLAVVLLGTLLLLCSWPAAAQPATKATIDGTPQLKWQPADVTIAPGGTVTFKIVGTTPHPVGSGSAPPKDDGKFDTAGCQPDKMSRDGASCTVQFKKAGTYPYFCQLHYAAGMVGTITVGGGDGGGASTATATSAGGTSVVATPRTVTPTGSGRPAIYWAGYGLFALGALIGLVTLFAYVRYAPRFRRPWR